MKWLALVLALAVPGTAFALPESDRTPETKRLLAAAMVAEAGWHADADHRGIFHVIRKRYVELKKFESFADQLRAYVAVFDPRTKLEGRTVWLRSLARDDPIGPPEGWPDGASWKRHRLRWARVLERASRCIDGRDCDDPYRGRARHWGGVGIDHPQGCMVALPRRGTRNVFYAIDWACKRRRRVNLSTPAP